MRGYKRLAIVAVVIWLAAVLLRAGIASSFELRMQLDDSQRAQTLLAATGGRCRVLVIGSSPAIYGLSAAALSVGTQCSAANLALIDVSARVDDYLDRLLESVGPGDIVVFTDRRWTQNVDVQDACAPVWKGGCLMTGLKFAPYLLERLRLFMPDGVPRDASGDLVVHPPMTARLAVIGPLRIDRLDERVAIIDRQARAIRARGACPILASTPMLVTVSAQRPLAAAYAKLETQVSMQIYRANWLPPAIETSPVLFSLEGQHLSAKGRERWSEVVGRAIQENCLSGAP
jgi:hypothetical protein